MRLGNRLAFTIKGLVLAATVSVAGCGALGDGVSLNGGVFDALGLSDKGNSAPREPKVQERAGLVLPPTMGQLPKPGAGQEQEQVLTSQQAWPVSPEQRRVAVEQQKEAEHTAYCYKVLQHKKLNRDLSVTEGPLGPCSPSALNAIGIDPNQTLKQAQGAGRSGLPK